ncbi:MAG: creatininase family protein [Cyanobacteria bacterium P01_D01_bin.73]
MAMPIARDFSSLTWQEVAALPNRDRTVLILPIGAIEQHGHHLPLKVDSVIVSEILNRALDRLDPAIPAYGLPLLPYGKSNEHLGFPGTIALSAKTLLATVMEIGECVYRAGFRRLVLMNGHGGQPQVLEIAATDLRVKFPDFYTFAWFVWRGAPEYKRFLSEREGREGLHGGVAETSLMLALDAETVRGDRATMEYPKLAGDGGLIGVKGPTAATWRTEDLSRTGVIGDGTSASLEIGAKLLEELVSGWVELITAAHQFEFLGSGEISPTPPSIEPH